MFSELSISVANADEVIKDAASQPSALQSMLPIVMIFAVFYFFIIRPQSKKFKDQQATTNNTQVGDEVIILSGVFGKIFSISQDETCLVEISKGNEIKIYKTAIVKNISLEERNKTEALKNISAKKK